MHYVKKSGATSEKVFKWKELSLAPGAAVSLSRKLRIRNFTTRVHHAGVHKVEPSVNGVRLMGNSFLKSSMSFNSGSAQPTDKDLKDTEDVMKKTPHPSDHSIPGLGGKACGLNAR